MSTDWSAEERAVIETSPTAPRVEYVPRHLANRVKCDCPRVTVDVEPGTHAATLFDPELTPWALKILHRQGGHPRVRITAPRAATRPAHVHAEPARGGRDFIAAYLAKLPPPKPCPACGGVRFLAGPAGPPERECWSCGHVFDPTRPALAVLPGTDQPRRAREGRPVLLSTDAEEVAI